MSHKWTSPYDWLADTACEWNKDSLYNALCCVAREADSDTLQNIFQANMDEDGYFEEDVEMRLAVGVIWAEMARRKVQFHNDEQWNEIKLWGLFDWSSVSRLIENGQLRTDMKKENRVIWVTPSKKVWETKIKPLIDQHSLEELSRMAGW